MDVKYKHPIQHQRREEQKLEKASSMNNLTDTLTEMAKANLQMKLIGMIDNQSSSGTQQQPSQPYYYQPPQPPPYHASYYPYQPPPAHPTPPLPPQPQFRPPTTIAEPTGRTSSPLASLDEEELAIKAFFTWKREKTSTAEQKNRISEAEETYNTNIWTLKDLKKMNKLNSKVYELAMEAGIPDGLARGFKRDLKAFKPQWKRSREEAMLIIGVGQ